MENSVLFLRHISDIDKEILGSDITNLAILEKENINITPSVILTNSAFFYFLSKLNLIDKLTQHSYKEIKKIILESNFPEEISKKILKYYHKIAGFPESELKITGYIIYNNSQRELASINIKGESNLILEIKNLYVRFLEENFINFNSDYNYPKIVLLIQKNPKFSVSGSFTNLRYESNKKIIEIKIKDKKLNKFTFNKDSISLNQIPKKYEKYITPILKIIPIIDRNLYLPKTCNFYFLKNKLFIDSIHDDFYLNNSIKKIAYDENLIATGETINPGIVTGRAGKFDANKLTNDILILDFIGRSELSQLKIAKGLILTKKENISILKTLQIPIIYAPNIKAKLNSDQIITINATEGKIFKGGYIQPKVSITSNHTTATKLILKTNNSSVDTSQTDLVDGIFSENIIKISNFPKKIIYNLDTHDKDLDIKLKNLKHLKNTILPKHISICISNALSVNDILNIKKTLATVGLYRNHSFEYYISISTISLSLSFSEISELGIDGIILDLKKLSNFYFGIESSYLNENSEFEKIILNSISNFSKHNIKVFADLGDIRINEKLFLDLIKNGINGFLVNKNELSEVKTQILALEHELIK